MSSPPKKTAHLAELVAIQVSSAFRVPALAATQFSTTDAANLQSNYDDYDSTTLSHPTVARGAVDVPGKWEASDAGGNRSKRHDLYVLSWGTNQSSATATPAVHNSRLCATSRAGGMTRERDAKHCRAQLGSPQPGPRHRSEAEPNWLPPIQR